MKPRRLLSCIAALMLVIGLVPAAASAAIDYDPSNCMWAADWDFVLADANGTATMAVEVDPDVDFAYTLQWYHGAGEYIDAIQGAVGTSCTAENITGPEPYFVVMKGSDGEQISRVDFMAYPDSGMNVKVAGTENDLDQQIITAPGGNAVMAVEGGPDDAGITYSWYKIDPQTNEPGNVLKQGADATSYTAENVQANSNYFVKAVDKYDRPAEVWFNIAVDSGLTVYAGGTQDTYSNVDAALGEEITLKVDAGSNAGTLSYKWYYNTEKEEVILNSTTDSYTFSVTGSQFIYCAVSDGYGNTREVFFDVKADSGLKAYVKGTQNNSSQVSVAQGETAFLEVEAAVGSGGLHYSWYRIVDGEYVLQEGADASFTTPAVTEKTAYVCQAADDYGNVVSVSFDVAIDSGLAVTVTSSAEYEVLDYPDISYMIAYIFAEPGEDVNISVSARSDLAQPVITWTSVYNNTVGAAEPCDISGSSVTIKAPSDACKDYLLTVSDGAAHDYSVTIRFNTSGLRPVMRDITWFMDVLYAENGGNCVISSEEITVDRGNLRYTWYGAPYTEENLPLIEGASSSTYTAEGVSENLMFSVYAYDDYGLFMQKYFFVIPGEVTYTWSEDNSSVTAEFAATNQELMAQIDSVKDKLYVPPLTETVNTTSQDGGNDSTIYTAEFTGMAFTKQTKTVEAVRITKAVDANGAPVAADAQILAEADKPDTELTPEKAAEIIASIVDGEQTAATDDDVEVPDTVDTDSLAKVDPTDLTIVLVKDVTVPPGTAFPVTLSFELADVQDGQDVFVYHYSTDPVSGQKSWELVGTGKGKNVDATFDDLSPVVFVAQAVSVPPTGDAGYMQWVVLAAAAVAVAACVLVFAGRRREE